MMLISSLPLESSTIKPNQDQVPGPDKRQNQVPGPDKRQRT